MISVLLGMSDTMRGPPPSSDGLQAAIRSTAANISIPFIRSIHSTPSLLLKINPRLKRGIGRYILSGALTPIRESAFSKVCLTASIIAR